MLCERILAHIVLPLLLKIKGPRDPKSLELSEEHWNLYILFRISLILVYQIRLARGCGEPWHISPSAVPAGEAELLDHWDGRSRFALCCPKIRF